MNDDDNDDWPCFVLDGQVEPEFQCASSRKQQSAGRQDTLPKHTLLTLVQPVFVLTTKFCVISGEIANTNLNAFGLTRLWYRTNDLFVSKSMCRRNISVSTLVFIYNVQTTCRLLSFHIILPIICFYFANCFKNITQTWKLKIAFKFISIECLSLPCNWCKPVNYFRACTIFLRL